MTSEVSWIERFYTHFLARDICYLFSGGLFICVIEYTLWGNIFLPKESSLEVLGFLMVSYFIGLTISGINLHINISGNIPQPVGYSDSIFFTRDFIKNYDERIINLFERYIFFMTVGKSVGLSSLFGAVLMIINYLSRLILKIETPSYEYLLLAFSLLISGIYMILDSRYWAGLVTKVRDEIAKEIKSNSE